MARERQLHSRSEDADPRVTASLRRQDEDRLGEVQLAREGLHLAIGQSGPVREDGKRVAFERLCREDVAHDVGKAHSSAC